MASAVGLVPIPGPSPIVKRQGKEVPSPVSEANGAQAGPGWGPNGR